MPEYTISGVPVSFPFEPYAVQRTYMEKVIECLQMSQNGVLESPTGTGKTLSLLCSTLGWLMIKKAHLQINAQVGCDVPGVDFLAGLQSKLNTGAGVVNNGERSGTWGMPKIIYASRTHGQLTQAMQELKRTTYNHMKVAVLGSRDQLCIHSEVMKETNNANKVHLCRMHVSARTCVFYNNVDAKKEDPAFNNAGILDIEDLVKVGRKLRCCPYYVAKDMKTRADIVFMPYNYLLDPKTRRAHGIELANNIVILDEAHNIEKMCEESASLQIRSTDVALCIDEVTQVMKELMEQQPMDEGFNTQLSGSEAKDFTKEELSLLKTMMLELEKVLDEIPVEKDGSTYPGSYIFEVLSKADLTHSKKTVVLELIDKIVQYLSTTSSSPFQRKGSGLQKFSDLLKVAFSGDVQTLAYIENIKRCYKVHVSVEVPKKQGKSDSWSNLAPKSSKPAGRILSYWCFSPGFGMQQLVDQGVRCVILTSGTLSPLPPLVSELGIKIGVQLENPHIIKHNQVCVSVVGKGPDGFPLTSSYSTRNDPAYITSLGRTILNFCRIIPNGLLVFFSSYPIMKKCQEDWQQSGIWSQITCIKEIFVEPQGKDSFNETMSGYYTQVQDPTLRGACFMAVVRGKVSEGLDFADINGRAVIITGVPYPPFLDPRVVLKQKYLDETRSKTGGQQCLSGAEWYQLEASRAVNQAVGRVIRHADDYGAILLCDHRFGNPGFKQKLSAWLRPHLKIYPDFGVATRDIREFFRAAEHNLPPPKIKQLSGVTVDGEGKRTTSVAAGFDQTSTRLVNINPRPARQSTITSTLTKWSPSDYLMKTNSSKEHQPKSLFDALQQPTTAIDFNDMTSLPSASISRNVDRFARPSKALKLKPMNFSASKELTCECREKSSDGLCTCQKASTLKISQQKLDLASGQKAAILMYLKELKKSLDVENYLKFANTFKDYKTSSDYDEFMKKSQEIFLAKEQLHPLLKDFSRFIKKEHLSKFLMFCATLSGCRR